MKWLKRIGLGIGVLLLGVGGMAAVMASRYVPTIQPNVFVAGVPVGGLTHEEAAKKMRIWWETERRKTVQLQNSLLSKQPSAMTLTALGLDLDPVASVEQAPLDEFWLSAKRWAGIEKTRQSSFDAKFAFRAERLKLIEDFVLAQNTGASAARVTFVGDAIVRIPEKNGLSLDKSRMQEAVMTAWKGSGVSELPLTQATKSVPDSELEKITEVVTSYTTSFSTAKTTRCSNIRLASSIINGTVLMPGDRFSFNETVGRRTVKAGFKIAGVYKNGKHDFDVGGGICQVSTTLYNAALLSNLAIKERHNHSMPVPYVPLGRDATVDYGSRDLVLENNTETPIAITSLYKPGKLTFTILGKKTPGQKVEILAGGRRTWSAGIQYVTDPSLSPGKSKTVDKGGIGASISTTRVVFVDGKEVAREPLGQSYYRGGKRIIARGPAAKSPSLTPEGRAPVSSSGETPILNPG